MPKLGEAYVVYKAQGLDKLHSDIGGASTAFKAGAAAIVGSVAAITAAVVKIGVPFEQMVVDAGSAMRATAKQMADLEAAARKAGATTEHTATQAAESLMFLGKAGLSAGQAIQALPGMMDFKTAIGSLMSLGQATDVITDSMTSMGLEVKDLSHLTDLFVGVSNRSSINVAQVGESFTKVAGIARLYGTSVEDLTALLGILGSAGIKAELAGTGLKNAFINTSKAASELGIKNEGLIETLKAVKAANWDADQIAKTYGKIALPSVVAILKEIDGSGPGSLSFMVEELSHVSDGMGESAAQAEKMRATVGNQFKIIVSQVEDLALSIFENWKPAMLEGIKSTQDFLAANKTAIVSVGDILLPLLQDVGAVLAAGAKVGVDAIGLLNASMIGLVDISNRGFLEIEHAGKVAWAGLQTAFGVVFGEMFKVFGAFVELATEVSEALGMDEMAEGFRTMSASIKTGVSDMNDLAGAIGKATDERRAALEQHDKLIETMQLEKQGYSETAAEGRKSAEQQLKYVRSIAGQRELASKKQLADLVKIAEAEVKTSKEIVNVSKKQTKALKKNTDDALKDFFGALDEQGKRWSKHNDDMLKDRAEMAKEMEKLEAAQFQEFDKQLEESKRLYEDFIRDQIGIKELSAESLAEIDRQYQTIKDDILSGEIESFDSAMTDILTAKSLSMEKLMENDTAYSVFLSEQEAENKRIRMDFFEKTGGMSTEYFAKLAGEIEAQAGVWQKAGVDAVAVEEWKLDQFRALDMQRLESSDNFFDGVRMGMLESQKDMTTWTDAGRNIFGTFQNELAGSFNQLFTGIIRGDMNSLSGAWDSLWRGMLDTVVSNLSKMAAEWASQQIAGLAMSGAEALSSAIFAKDGAFDVGRTGPGQPDPALGGAIPALLHAGESVLPAGLTDQLSGASFEDFKAGVRNYFGLDSGQADSIWSRASEYKGTGANLYKAWQAFDEGNEIQGVIEAMDAMSEAFKTYAQQNGSQVAASIGQGLGEASGVISSGYGAYSAFEAEDYLGAVTQSLNAVQSAVSLYGTATGTTAGTTGAVLGSTATGAISGAGQGLAAWNMLSALAEIEAGGKAPAQIGAAVGGAALGSAIGGPVGSVVGGIIGGIAGTGFSIAGEGEFDLSDADPHLAEARKIIDGKITMIPEPGPGGWFSVALGQYFNHLNTQAAAVNQLTDSIAGDMTSADAAKFKAQMTTALSGAVGTIESGGNYNRNRADQMIVGVGNYYWDQTLDAMRGVVGTASGISEQRKNELLGIMAGTEPNYWINPVDMPSNIARMEAERAAIDPLFAAQLEAKKQAQIDRMLSGGAATGGVVVPRGEDGMLGVQKGEGVIPLDAMKWAEDVGNAILSGQPFGGSFAAQDQPIDIGSFAGSLPGEVSTRGAVMSELLLNDTVTRLGEGNRLTEETNRLLMRVADVLNQILNAPRIDANGLVNFFLPTLENRVQNGDARLSSPSVVRAATSINNAVSFARQTNIGWEQFG